MTTNTIIPAGPLVWPFMPRAEFMARVGDPAASRASAAQLEAEALALWKTVQADFYTAAGKPKKSPASVHARDVNTRVNALRTQAQKLVDLAYAQKRAQDDPWSHTRLDSLMHWAASDFQHIAGPFTVCVLRQEVN